MELKAKKVHDNVLRSNLKIWFGRFIICFNNRKNQARINPCNSRSVFWQNIPAFTFAQ